MEHIGHIESADDTQPLSYDAWLAVIAESDDLHAIPPREGINPFTRKPTLFYAAEDSVRLIRDDTHIGSFAWAQDKSAAVNVACSDGYREMMAVAAREFAQVLGCVFSEFHAGS